MRPPVKKLRDDDPCPCGSNTRYSACHGASRAVSPTAPRSVAPARAAAVVSAVKALSRPVFMRERFLDAASCALLIEGFERNVARVAEGTADPYWSSRLLYYQSLTHEPAMRAIMRGAREGFVRELRGFYSVPEMLYSDTVHLVRWREGQSMRAHADNAHLDGTPNEYPWRDFATVLYLNDDFDGGELFFERTGLTLKPRAGTLVGFTGGLDHVHGVTEVRRGTRYTMPAWHTRDAARRDRDFD